MNKVWIVDVGSMPTKKAYTYMQNLMLELRDRYIKEHNITGYKKLLCKLNWYMKHGVI